MALFNSNTSQENKELKLAREKQKAQQRAFKQQLALQRSHNREELAHQHAERALIVTQQRTAQAKAEADRRSAVQQKVQAENALRHQRIDAVKETVKPYFKPVVLGGLALKGGYNRVASGAIEKFYVLGTRPQNSPSFEILEKSFEGQPFTATQATQVLANARQIGTDDAYNRLKIMKQNGYIKEGGL